MCGNGAAMDKPVDASPENISSVASFIETKLIVCYLQIRQPDLALNHAHRSNLNPSYFNQAAVFRTLVRYSEAARSAMIADYIYWLSGRREEHISKLIKLYWQAMFEEAISRAEALAVMFTPFFAELKPEELKELFSKRHPAYTKYIYARLGVEVTVSICQWKGQWKEDSVLHVLPQMVDWSSAHPQQYLPTLGFKRKKDGLFLEKKITNVLENKNPFSPLSNEEAKRHMEILEKRILPVLDYMLCTKFLSGCSPCSGAIGKLQHASILSQLQQVKEQSQVINQALAELATIPYLQEISQQDAELVSIP
ncbi:LOW QUALITY PROTEIN: spermatogenesis-associated protein 16 [Rhinophrynus dorsalis]